MPIKAVTSIGPGVRYDLNPNQSLSVGRGVSVISTDDIAIRVPNEREDVVDRVTITVAGLVRSGVNNYCIYVAQRGEEDALRIVVEKTGTLIGLDGIRVVDFVLCDVTIANHGTIVGKVDGISLTGGEKATITNTGTILAERYGVNLNGADDATVFRNSGRVVGGELSFEGGSNGNRDTVINSGVMTGDVGLLDGNDLYDGRGGRVNGTVFGGEGNDRFIAGAARDVFDGGAGTDTLDFRKGGAVKVALDGAFANAGAAARGDIYTGFEVLLGSARNDSLRGDDAANRLAGNGGNDRLNGAGGADMLTGGAGRDTLTGGEGQDEFVFLNARGGADRITDFDGGPAMPEPDDAIAVSARGFGLKEVGKGGFNEGWFHAGRTNQAQDRNDHFIFRKGDTTLWFDADGKGGRGPVLLADLQAGAELTANNFTLI